MPTLNSTANDFVRPGYFIIRGFSEISYVNYYYIFLFFCFAGAVIGNLLVMTIITVVRSLHTPKYMAVFNLALADLGESTALIPSLVETFIYTSQQISYEACLINLFCDLTFFCMQSITLTVLAYDRFVAICFPLRYHSIITNTSMGALLAVLWLFDLIIATLMVSLITRLSFCDSIVVNSFYCEHGPVYRLSCSDISLNSTVSTIAITLFYFIPMILIGLSYASILLALFKIASWEERLKAIKTCFSHIILVCVFYIPLVTVDVVSLVMPVHINVRVISTSLSSTVPPVLNPIVYSLNTAEIREFVKKMFKRNRKKDMIPAISK